MAQPNMKGSKEGFSTWRACLGPKRRVGQLEIWKMCFNKGGMPRDNVFVNGS